MKPLAVGWIVLKNIIALFIFWAALGAVDSKFQTIVVAGLGLIYSLLVHYATAIVQIQLGSAFSRTAQYIKLQRAIAPDADLETAEERLNAEREQVNGQGTERTINMVFNGIIWATAVIAIVLQL